MSLSGISTFKKHSVSESRLCHCNVVLIDYLHAIIRDYTASYDEGLLSAGAGK
jgi:hypothetical protein